MLTKVKSMSGSILGNVLLASHNIRSVAPAALVGAISTVVPFTAAEAQSLGDIGNTMAASGTGLKTAALTLFAVVGIGMVGMALIKWKNASKSGEGMGGIIGMLAIGAILMSVAAVIGVFQSTVFGSDQSAAGMDLLK